MPASVASGTLYSTVAKKTKIFGSASFSTNYSVLFIKHFAHAQFLANVTFITMILRMLG